MAIVFHVISTQLNAYRSSGGSTASLAYAGGNSAPAVITDTAAGVFAQKLIQMTHTTSYRHVQWPGGLNMPAATGPMSVRVRIVPRYTGHATAATVLWVAEGIGSYNTNVCWLYLDTTSKLNFLIKDVYGATTFVNSTSLAISPTVTSGTPVEFMATWDGTTGANKVRFSMDGVAVSTHTAAATAAAWDRSLISYIASGGSSRFPVGNFDLNELVVYNTEESHTYTPGATFVSDSSFDGAAISSGGGAPGLGIRQMFMRRDPWE